MNDTDRVVRLRFGPGAAPGSRPLSSARPVT